MSEVDSDKLSKEFNQLIEVYIDECVRPLLQRLAVDLWTTNRRQELLANFPSCEKLNEITKKELKK